MRRPATFVPRDRRWHHPSTTRLRALDGEIIRDGEPGSSQDQSLSERVTGADAETRSPDEARSLGAQSTAGDIGSSVSDLGVGLVLEKIRGGD